MDSTAVEVIGYVGLKVIVVACVPRQESIPYAAGALGGFA